MSKVYELDLGCPLALTGIAGSRRKLPRYFYLKRTIDWESHQSSHLLKSKMSSWMKRESAYRGQ
jgi:hypothetical protein